MSGLIALCIRHRLVLALLAVLTLLAGINAVRSAPLDVFPEFVPPQVTVQTESPGLSPDQVEVQVTTPLESLLSGAIGLESMRSESIAGLSVISLGFADGIDPLLARQGIAERLAGASALLPAAVALPQMSPLTSSTMDLLKIGLLSDQLDAYALRELADYSLKPRLLALPGVARVTVFGGDVRQLQIQLDPERMRAQAIGVPEVLAAARAALGQRGGGAIELASQRLQLAIRDTAVDPASLGATVITVRNGRPLLLRDVATVADGAALKAGDALIQGQPGVLLAISGQFGANTLDTTLALESAIAELQPQLDAAGVRVVSPLHRPANFIELALANLGRALLLGSLLILILLMLFLHNWRTVLISFVTIPLSLLAAVIVLSSFGVTLNTMTLGGFAVALGVLVDDAIIGIENIVRRLKLNAALAAPEPFLDVIRSASVEIRGPVFYATIVVLLVFAPVFAMGGVQGRLLAPLALAFALAVLASLLVALTVTPALCALLLRGHAEADPPRWLEWLSRRQQNSMDIAHRHLPLTISALLLAMAAAMLSLPHLGGEFFPTFREGHFVLQVSSRLPGTSIGDMLAAGRSISAEVLQLPYVQSIEQQVGRAQQGEDTWGTHRSEFHVELKADSGVDQMAAQAALRDILAGYPALQSEVLTFLGDRISETLTGETAQVVVNVVGPDLDQLDQLAGQIMGLAAKVPGVVDLRSSSQSGTPSLNLALIPQRLAQYGLRVADVQDSIASAYAGTVVGQIHVLDRPQDVVVTLPPSWRERPESIGQLMLTAVDGSLVPLARVAEITPADSRYSIDHDGGRRRVVVAFNVSGRPTAQAVDELRQILSEQLQLPPRTFIEFGGVAEAEQQGRRELWLYGTLALAAILMVVGMSFRRRVHVPLLLANLPFALLGAIAAIALSGVGLSIGALIGMVTVFGISARNAILLLAHYEHLVFEEGAIWSPDTAWRGARERLRPVLMTALVTALGLVPLALGIGRAGHEIEAPMAIAVLGGLVSSTLLTLMVLPALALRYSFRGAAKSQVA